MIQPSAHMNERFKGDSMVHGTRLALRPGLLRAVVSSVAGEMLLRDMCPLSRRCPLPVPAREAGRGCFPRLGTRLQEELSFCRLQGSGAPPLPRPCTLSYVPQSPGPRAGDTSAQNRKQRKDHVEM